MSDIMMHDDNCDKENVCPSANEMLEEQQQQLLLSPLDLSNYSLQALRPSEVKLVEECLELEFCHKTYTELLPTTATGAAAATEAVIDYEYQLRSHNQQIESTLHSALSDTDSQSDTAQLQHRNDNTQQVLVQQDILTDTNEADVVDVNISIPPQCQRKRKRTRDPLKIIEIQRQKHPMLEICSCKVYKCSTKFTEEDRKEIWLSFWKLDRQRRRDFISRSVLKKPTGVKTRSESRRHNTLVWQLNEKIVCKTMFLHTLGYTNDEAVQSVLKANYLTNNKAPNIAAAPDPRGHHTPKHAFPATYENDLKDFIERFKPMQSHYNIKHAPNRRYLPIGVNFSLVYKQFQEHCENNNLQMCSWSYFYSVIKGMNLSTAETAQDICTICKKHDIRHQSSEESPHSCTDCECDDCVSYPQHISNKREARKDIKKKEKECEQSGGSKLLFTVDMQKVICMPVLKCKEYYFSRKLMLLNETFVPPGKNKHSFCMIWHEGESGRKAHNVASAFVHFIRKKCRDAKEIYLFLDNCNAQNKNKTLLSALVRLVNDNMTVVEKITLEYFEPGHTFMAADSLHAAITKKISAAGEVYDLDDFINRIKSSRKNVDIEILTHEDMMLIENECKAVFPKNWNIHALKIIQFSRGSLTLLAKNEYLGDFKEIHFLKKKAENNLKKKCDKNETDLFALVSREEAAKGISELKKKDLMELCKVMPLSRAKFYHDLKVSNTEDLDEQVEPNI